MVLELPFRSWSHYTLCEFTCPELRPRPLRPYFVHIEVSARYSIPNQLTKCKRGGMRVPICLGKGGTLGAIIPEIFKMYRGILISVSFTRDIDV